MDRACRAVALFVLIVGAIAASALAQQYETRRGGQPLTDAQVRERLIEQSIARYQGLCACPYSVMADGRECGQRSAYERFSGAAPLCYPDDVTDKMVREYRNR